jgi:hypothetical protein
MTKEHAIKNFVNKYFRLLKSKDGFDGKEYDQIKRAYFGTDLRFLGASRGSDRGKALI